MEFAKGTLCIFKRGSRWCRGRTGGKRDPFYGIVRVPSLSETRGSKFVSLAAFLRINKITEKEEKILKSLDVDRLYIKFKKPQMVGKAKKRVSMKELSPAKYEDLWWSKLNKFCLRCIHNCKQSSRAIVICCKSYKKGG